MILWNEKYGQFITNDKFVFTKLFWNQTKNGNLYQKFYTIL